MKLKADNPGHENSTSSKVRQDQCIVEVTEKKEKKMKPEHISQFD